MASSLPPSFMPALLLQASCNHIDECLSLQQTCTSLQRRTFLLTAHGCAKRRLCVTHRRESRSPEDVAAELSDEEILKGPMGPLYKNLKVNSSFAGSHYVE